MRLPLTGLSGCGLLRVFRAACRLSPFLCVCSFTVPLFFLYPFLCRFSVCIFFPCMCPYCFLPVPLVLLAFFLCPTPGCRAYRDPGVRRAETRMSDMSRPGCHAMPFQIFPEVFFSFCFFKGGIPERNKPQAEEICKSSYAVPVRMSKHRCSRSRKRVQK